MQNRRYGSTRIYVSIWSVSFFILLFDIKRWTHTTTPAGTDKSMVSLPERPVYTASIYPAYYSRNPSNSSSVSPPDIQCRWKKANVLLISFNAPPLPSIKNPSPGIAMKYAYRCTSGLSSIQGITSSRNWRICSTVPLGLNSVI